MGWGADTKDHKKTPGGTLTPMGGPKSGCAPIVVVLLLWMLR